ncbi:MAG: glycosyltransferase [Bacteroidales bacterium]|nr:glycosyltransferase [Bacteroidales bacterium]
MKVGFIAWERFSYGGVSRIISSLVNELSKDIDIEILCLKSEKSFENVYNIDTNKIKFSFTELTTIQKIRREIANKLLEKINITSNNFLLKNFPYIKYANSYLKKIVKWINSNHFDIVVFASGFEDCIQLAAIKDSIKKDIKLIAWSHASFKDYFRSDYKIRSNNQQKLWQYYYKNFDSIIVLSDADVFECKKYLGLNAIRIYNANSFSPNTRTKLNNKSFVYVGSLSETKGTDILIDAFVKFAEKNNDWNLNIYGEGKIREYIEAQINKHNLNSRVKLHNYTTDVESVYLNNDIFILPSRFEGFGIVQIEAISYGLPIIASELAITKELISKYNYGKIFKYGDPDSLSEIMLWMINQNLITYSVNGHKAAKDFEISNISKEWLLMLNNTRKINYEQNS